MGTFLGYFAGTARLTRGGDLWGLQVAMSLLTEFDEIDRAMNNLHAHINRDLERLEQLDRSFRMYHDVDRSPLFELWDADNDAIHRESTVLDPLLSQDEDTDRRFSYYDEVFTNSIDTASESEDEDEDGEDDRSFVTSVPATRDRFLNDYGLDDAETDVEEWFDPYSTPI